MSTTHLPSKRTVQNIAIDLSAPAPSVLFRIAGCLQNGGIAAIPTDTCYGLAVNPFHATSVDRLFVLKGRDRSKPIPLLISHMDMLRPLVREVTPLAEQIMTRCWPGPLTLIFKASEAVPPILTGGTHTIGLRLPNSPFLRGLIEVMGCPITATSANRSGAPPLPSAEAIEAGLGGFIDLIVEGGECGGLPSTVLDVRSSRIKVIREGALALSTFARVMGWGPDWGESSPLD